MAGYLFGITPDDWVSSADGRPVKGATVRFYTDMVSTTPVSITTSGGSSATSLTTNAQGFWDAFTGPDGVVVLYVSANGGPRRAILSPAGIAAVLAQLLAGGGGSPLAYPSTTLYPGASLYPIGA